MQSVRSAAGADAIKINLTNMSDNQKRLLAYALSCIKNCYITNTNLPDSPFISEYELITEHKSHIIILNHNIVYHYNLGSFIVVAKEDLIGSGGQGSVYASCGEIVIIGDTIQYKENTNLVVKLLWNNELNLSFIKNEEISARKFRYLDFQTPLIGNKHIVVIMNRIKGFDLVKSLYPNRTIFLSTKALIEISLKILYQIQFIHRHDCLHLDLKPHNTIITNKQTHYSVRMIDFGFSIPEIKKTLTGYRGTLGYCAPELIRQFNATTYADAYSTGALLAYLWGYIPNKNELNDTQFKDRNFNLSYFDLLATPENIRKFINDAIHGLTRVNIDPSKNDPLRYSIDEAIHLFHQAGLAFKYTIAHPKDYQTINSAFNISIAARTQLRNLNCSPDEMKSIIVNALSQLDDNFDAIDEFCEVTNIKAFIGLKTKEACLKKLNEITLNYSIFATQNPNDPIVKKINERAKLDNMSKLGLFTQQKLQEVVIPPPPKKIKYD